MDFAEYAAERRAPLFRTAVLLGRAALARNAATGSVWQVTATQGGQNISMCNGRTLLPRFDNRASVQLSIRARPPAVGCAILNVFLGPLDQPPTSTVVGAAIDGIVVRTAHLTFVPPSDSTMPNSPDAAVVGQSFRDLAQGGQQRLRVAGPVAFYVQSRLIRHLTAAEARRTDSYAPCSTRAPGNCPKSPMTLIREARSSVHPAQIGGHLSETCLDSAPMSAAEVGAADVVLLTNGLAEKVPADQPPSAALTCAETWAVQIFYDHVAQIVAINLLVGSP